MKRSLWGAAALAALLGAGCVGSLTSSTSDAAPVDGGGVPADLSAATDARPSDAAAPLDQQVPSGDLAGAADLAVPGGGDLAGVTLCVFDDPNSAFDDCVISP